MARLRFNFMDGTIGNNPLDIDDDILSSDGLIDFPALTSPDYAVLILDPTRVIGEPEIIYIIDHDEDSPTALVMRGQEESVAREHTQGVRWVHGAVAKDFEQTYVHHQQIPTDTWFIQHNLGRYPGVTVVDSAGSVVVGDPQYNDNTSITIRFSTAFSGKAYLD